MTNKDTTAKELSAHLAHLTLSGQDSSGDLEWLGTKEQWQEVNNDLTYGQL